jgi:hypothetical protein
MLLNTPIVVHAAKNPSVLRILKADFEEWLTKRGDRKAEIVTAVKNVPGVKVIQTNLGAGTNFNSGSRVWVLEFDLTQMPSDFYTFT